MREIFRRMSARYWAALAAVALATGLVSVQRVRALSVQAAAMAEQGSAYTFIIDAGHGGEDGGASTADGVAESGINLAVAQRLDAMLVLLGQKTVMVRTRDEAVYDPGCKTFSEKKVSDLHNRAKLVNETPGAFLISIHQNQFDETKYSGAQVFYNAQEPSRQLAEALQAALAGALDSGNHRQAKSAQDTVYLMRAVRAPALLVECGFLSNPEEARRLQEPDYQKKLALAIAHTVTDYLQKETEHEV